MPFEIDLNASMWYLSGVLIKILMKLVFQKKPTSYMFTNIKTVSSLVRSKSDSLSSDGVKQR